MIKRDLVLLKQNKHLLLFIRHSWESRQVTDWEKRSAKHVPEKGLATRICKETQVLSHPVVPDSLRPQWLQPTRLLCPWDSPGKSTGVGSHSLLQGIFPTLGSNPGLLHCRRILYRLSHQGSPRILEWVALSLLLGSTLESNQGLLHCRQILYQLSYQGIPKET